MAVVDIVPKPFFAEETGNVLMLGPKIRVFARTAELESVVRVWKESLCKPYAPGVSETAAGFRRIVSDATLPGIVLSAKARNADVCLSVDAKLAAEEYVLEISSEGIAIRGGSPSGVRWGLQTLSQVLIGRANEQPGNETLRLSGLRIADKPRFAYRGAMLDCCRHFFTVEEVKSFIDVMFLHKLNTFHWHLTDDQGWRIEIRKYPFLTQIGSMRKETLIGHIQKSKEYDGTPYGGYYPHLGCRGEGYEVRTTWGISKEVVCLGNDAVYDFFRDVLDEVAELFPGEIIHIGGDEAKADNWKQCPKCQARLRELGLESERQLQGHLVAKMEEHLRSRGKRILGWDEILTAGVTSGAIVMSWRGPAGGIKAASMGNDVVMAPNTSFYLDYYQTTDPAANGEPLAIGGSLPMEKCYAFEPFDQLDEYTKHHILGLQANLWTEFISEFDHAEYMLLPRLAALAEVGWSYDNKDFDSFKKRETSLARLYDAYGYKYAKHMFPADSTATDTTK